MAARYQHVTDPILRDVATRIDGLIWRPPSPPTPPPDDGGGGAEPAPEQTN